MKLQEIVDNLIKGIKGKFLFTIEIDGMEGCISPNMDPDRLLGIFTKKDQACDKLVE